MSQRKRYYIRFIVTVVALFVFGVIMSNSVKNSAIDVQYNGAPYYQKAEVATEIRRLDPSDPTYNWVVNAPGSIGTYESNFKNPCWFVGSHSAKNLRCVPYLYVLGVGKSGSTTFSRCLNEHPEIALPKKKEIGYFDRGPKGLDAVAKQYTTHFQEAAEEIYNSAIIWNGFRYFHNKITYDGTPRNVWYLFLQDNILKFNKEARLVIIMRNPTKRLYSHYHHECVRLGKRCSPVLFHAAVKREIATFLKCRNKYSVTKCVQKQPWGKVNVKYSIYFAYVTLWLERFPSNQMLFIKAEEFYQNVTKVMDGVFRFLQLAPMSDVMRIEMEKNVGTLNPPGLGDLINRTPSLKQMKNNTTNTSTVYEHAKEKWREYHETILPETKKTLNDFYAPYNKMLADLLRDDRFLFQNTKF